MVGKGLISVLQGRISGARWAAGQLKSSVQQGRASGSRCQGRLAWRGAALWVVALGCLSCGLEPASVTPGEWWTPPFWVFLINVLAPPMPSVEFPQESSCGGSCSADTAPLTTCADIIGVSPCCTFLLWPLGQTCLLATGVYSDLGNFPLNQSGMTD